MLRKILTSLLPLLLAPATSSHAICDGLDYGITFHMTPTDYSGCGGVDDDLLTCETTDPSGGTGSQFLWVLAYGWREAPDWPADRPLGGILFAVHYPPSVTMSGWSLCTGGSEIAVDNPVDGTWPESDTGLAATWPGSAYDPDSGFAKVGYLVVDEGSVGPVEVTEHAIKPVVQLVSGPPEFVTANVPPAGWSIADVDGSTGTGCRSCLIPPTPVRATSWAGVKAAFDR